MKKIVTILALLALLTSCGTKNTEEPTNLQTPDVQPITVDVDENGNVVIPEDEIT
jgi:hypothetical protein